MYSDLFNPGPVTRRLMAMFSTCGESDYIGEPVSITEHSLQAADCAREGGDNEVMVAALLHDIGHVVGMESGYALGMNGCGFPEHEFVGGEFLKKLNFSPRIQKLVKKHVTAKRYLCRKNPSYYDNLSEASKTTLTFQGGVMSVEEAEAFEMDIDFDIIISMRSWDEKAKVPNKVVPGIEKYSKLIDEFSHCENCYLLSNEQTKFFDEFGFLTLRNLLNFGGIPVEEVRNWIEQCCVLSAASGVVTSHSLLHEGAEPVSDSRTNASACCRQLVKELIGNITSQLFKRRAVLADEKVKFNWSGKFEVSDPGSVNASGPHQIQALVVVDPCAVDCGCIPSGLNVCGSEGDNSALTTTSACNEELRIMTTVSLKPGEVLLFRNDLPVKCDHLSSKTQRTIFASYVPLEDL